VALATTKKSEIFEELLLSNDPAAAGQTLLVIAKMGYLASTKTSRQLE
jgi:hypothetical protein